MERSVANLFGGGLKPNDPRRFLIEAMICSMHADGSVDPREIAVLERTCLLYTSDAADE